MQATKWSRTTSRLVVNKVSHKNSRFEGSKFQLYYQEPGPKGNFA